MGTQRQRDYATFGKSLQGGSPGGLATQSGGPSMGQVAPLTTVAIAASIDATARR